MCVYGKHLNFTHYPLLSIELAKSWKETETDRHVADEATKMGYPEGKTRKNRRRKRNEKQPKPLELLGEYKVFRFVDVVVEVMNR